jgi:hypothetical protein
MKAGDLTAVPAACKATSTLAEVIAGDASTLAELLAELIGAGGAESAQLVAISMTVARMGLLADTLASAHGGGRTCGGAADWLLAGSVAEAFKTLDKASQLRDAAT